ncbi:unnamed protein product [Effrenium voratum]|nr:unnamed protein product [Effrenium voratum]
MKSFIMDLFERYANESNIEGVDQYNACYGGQAAGLCTLSWVESDRWDGRYGIAVATDISEAHPAFMAFAGAAATATLFYPDAPMSHHSQRASCVLHRFDFCKPVGWHDMAPITDGKYSVECYLDALDACHSTLRQKLNGRGPLEVTDLNVFHTGGGYHIVRKAFERLVRCENKGIKPDEKERLVQTKLLPSVSLLKIIGPCHTVSSFLNTSSVIMNKMEEALGKIILVFTYGSGCAASMYQLRVDDVPFFDPLEIWKLQFYRNSIKVTPAESAPLHKFYVETWMKFDYKPMGRRTCKISIWKYEEDAYYLMEIDKFGRRFYHRGGMSTGPLDPSLRLPVDKAEERPVRESWGPIMAKPEQKPKAITSTKEEQFKEIESRPMRVVSVSGETLAEVDAEALSNSPLAKNGFGVAVKEELQDKINVSTFRLRLLRDKGILPDLGTWEELGRPQELQVVILPCGHGSEEQLLQAADRGGWWEVVVRFLCTAGADKEALDARGRGPLHLAVDSGRMDVVHYLLDAGANKDQPDHQGRTPLHEAVVAPQFSLVRLLNEAGVDKHKGDDMGRTALYEAACAGNKQAVVYLIQQGADVDARDLEARTSLHMASQIGCVGVVRCLLDAAASAETVDRDGWTPLHVACWFGRLGVVRLLCHVARRDRQDNQGRTALFLAASSGQADVVRCLIQMGADRNRPEASCGRSPLFEAARLRWGAVVEALCQARANSDQADQQGRTPLHVAIWNGSVHVVDVLLRTGADKNKPDWDGRISLEPDGDDHSSDLNLSGPA